ncbi:response regulator [Hymenobacter sp. HMF4947]|uniref:Response regulator n=1 Tax=Hymenobacter ginkgonis TaxID=2682976 RepID=A0A7K1T8P9_9BACT|nr:response regulator [Hymenobacter ginkgonis]MVN74775.1 response regulator [Hymenobacter ginkgonis]
MLTYLIDDDFISLYLAEHVLRIEDFTTDILLFSTAETALSSLVENLAEQVPRVIFLDLNMPTMDGWGFLQALEPYVAALLGRCRIYILTSSLLPSDRARAQEYPLVSGMLHKPLDAAELPAIKALLQEAF